MIRKIYVGRNSSGKSFALESEYKNDINENKILLPTEVKLDDEVKSDNKGSGTFIIDTIIPIVMEKLELQSDDIKNRLKETIDEAIVSNANSIVSKFKFNDKWRLEKLLSNEIPNEFKELGSGEKSRYIIKLLLDLDISGYNIYIDEPEKFSHPSLQVSLANLINELAINNDVFVITHSPKFLNELNIDNLEIINFYNNRESIFISDENLISILSGISDRSQNTLLCDDMSFNSISQFNDLNGLTFEEFKKYYFMPLYKDLVFYNNVIFVEDENTYLYIKQICKINNLSNIDIMYVNGKLPIIIFDEVVKLLRLNPLCIYDSDHKLIENDSLWQLEEPNLDQQYWNERLQRNNSFEIKKDIEHSVLVEGIVEQFSDAKGISSKKNRLVNKLKLIKSANEEEGSQYQGIIEKINEIFIDN